MGTIRTFQYLNKFVGSKKKSAYFIDVNLTLSFEGLEACSELGHFRKYAWNIGIVAMNTFFFLKEPLQFMSVQ